jgi:arylsulfatase A-like enzyme
MDIVLRPDVEMDSVLIKYRKEQYRNYMAMITACDESFRRLMVVLKKKNLYDNTLIVFTSDHGDLLGTHVGKVPKFTPHDYSMRIPLIISGNDLLPQNQISKLLIGVLDFMPTVLELLNIDIPNTVQGKNLSEDIQKGNDDAVNSIPLFAYNASWRGVYTKDWTYAEHLGGAEELWQWDNNNVLYRHDNDQGQLNNLFENKKYKGIQDSFKTLTYDWMDVFEDKGYTQKDFRSVYREGWEGWAKNYAHRPIDLLKKLVNKILK